MERRQSSWFRFPWSASPAPNPANQTQTGSQSTATQTPTQPITTTPTRGQTRAPPTITSTTQAPPSTTPGTASTQPAQTPKPESQPSSPPRTITQSQAPSQPASPSQPEKTSQTSPQARSLSRLASQPAGKTSPIPSSPSKTSPLTTRASSQPRPPPSSAEAPPLVSEKEDLKPEVSQTRTIEPQTNTEIIYDPVTNSENQILVETNIQHNGMAKQPSNLSGHGESTAPTLTVASETPTPPRKSDSSSISADLKSHSELDGKSREPTEGKGAVQKANGVADEESKQTGIIELYTMISDSNALTEKQPGVTFQTEQKKQEEEVVSTKDMLTTSVSNGRQCKTMISRPKYKNAVSESRQKPVEGERVPLHKEIKNDVSKSVNERVVGHPKHLMKDKVTSVITLAGENRGASMHRGSESATKKGPIHIHRGYKINPHESAEATIDEEGSSNGRRPEDASTRDDKERKTYINSNLQSLSNSIMFNSSITERNPGVQLVHGQNLTEPIRLKNKRESLETHKAEFNTTPAEKLTYEPTVKRRCLRRLFVESSDSDPDNPEKPRRHGFGYGCRDKNTNKETDVI